MLLTFLDETFHSTYTASLLLLILVTLVQFFRKYSNSQPDRLLTFWENLLFVDASIFYAVIIWSTIMNTRDDVVRNLLRVAMLVPLILPLSALQNQLKSQFSRNMWAIAFLIILIVDVIIQASIVTYPTHHAILDAYGRMRFGTEQ